jgi:hypothetical protein
LCHIGPYSFLPPPLYHAHLQNLDRSRIPARQTPVFPYSVCHTPLSPLAKTCSSPPSLTSCPPLPTRPDYAPTICSRPLPLTFRVPPISLTLLKLDLGLPPLDLLTQAALARLDCRLQVLPPDHLCNETSTRLYAGRLSARTGTTKPTITTESKTLHSHEQTC